MLLPGQAGVPYDAAVVRKILDKIPLPRVIKIRQRLPCPRVEDVAGELWRQLAKDTIASRVKPGMSIAVTAGSRGVNNMTLTIKEVVRFLKEKGAKPFIVPAMGSHAGATAKGQEEILAYFGVTEESCGCPIRATMETVTKEKTVKSTAASARATTKAVWRMCWKSRWAARKRGANRH